jgi:hypothetical protein
MARYKYIEVVYKHALSLNQWRKTWRYKRGNEKPQIEKKGQYHGQNKKKQWFTK